MPTTKPKKNQLGAAKATSKHAKGAVNTPGSKHIGDTMAGVKVPTGGSSKPVTSIPSKDQPSLQTLNKAAQKSAEEIRLRNAVAIEAAKAAVEKALSGGSGAK